LRVDHHPNSDKITLSLGAGFNKLNPEEVHPQHVADCRNAGVELKECFHTFAVTPDAALPVGEQTTAMQAGGLLIGV
jgi:hypothetical protein